MESILNLSDDEKYHLNETIKIIKKNLDFFVVRFYEYFLKTEAGILFQNIAMEKQQLMFSTSLNIIFDHITYPLDLGRYLEDIAIRHKEYGVLAGHTNFFIDSFLTALKEVLEGQIVDSKYFDIWIRDISDVLVYFQEKISTF